jgi:hypothetical protein
VNPLARLGFVFSYAFVIYNTQFVEGPGSGGSRRLKVAPLALHEDVQRFRFLRSLIRDREKIPDRLPGDAFAEPCQDDTDESESHPSHYYYLRGGGMRVRRGTANYDQVMVHLLAGQKHALVLLLEPVMWGCFFVFSLATMDARESFSSPVWSSVLTVSVIAVRLVPDLSRVFKTIAKTHALNSNWHSIRAVVEKATVLPGSPDEYALSDNDRILIRFFMDVEDV